ncbi:hypothetical protein SDC9_177248 [bioreactor metagenome]|uniref:Uncharacterized protein n=1 Tax=bioreactor metagenome TaxID=1076179 RepID=A0A645GSS5_9ZZZZ
MLPKITMVVALKGVFLKRLSPIITLAKPTTTMPTPICWSADPLLCAITLPANAANPLPMANPRILLLPGSRERRVTYFSLLPVALRSRPDLVFRYTSKSSLHTTATTRETSMVRKYMPPIRSGMRAPMKVLKIVGLRKKLATLAPPLKTNRMTRLMERRAV